jgi:predicted Zn-dependent protease
MPATAAPDLAAAGPRPVPAPGRNAWQSHSLQEHPLPALDEVLALLDREAGDLDLVGIYAAGPISRGFASSFGAFGWHQANSFNFDWSLFHENGQAVKANYAGQLEREDFIARLRQAREQLGSSVARRTLKPGQLPRLPGASGHGRDRRHAVLGRFFRAVLASNSALQRLYNGDARFSPLVSSPSRSAAR